MPLETTGKRISMLRRDLGLSRSEVVEKVRAISATPISDSALGRYEKDEVSPPLDVTLALARVLESTVTYISTETDNIFPVNDTNAVDALEDRILDIYRALSDRDRQLVLRLLEVIRTEELISSNR